MAQQSTGRPYRCLPTTSGAERKTQLSLTPQPFSDRHANSLTDGCTEVLRSAAGVFDKAIFKFCQLEVADDYFGVLQAIEVHQVLQLNV